MNKSNKTLLVGLIVGLVLAVGLNMVTVRSETVGPDGMMRIKGLPFEAGNSFVDSTRSNRFVVHSYEAVFGNVLVAFFIVFGVLGNIYFLREMNKK